MSDSTEKVLLLILGWLLGLLSPAIVDAIRYYRETKRGRLAILAELQELSTVLVFATYRARAAAGTLDRAFLLWLQQRLRSDHSEAARTLSELVNPVLALPDEQIAQGAAQLATADSKATMLQQYPAPLLDSRVSALWTFDTQLQRQLLEIHRNLSLLDGIVAQSREFFRLTFNGLPSENHQRVSDNLKQSYGNYAERSQIIVDTIAGLQPTGRA